MHVWYSQKHVAEQRYELFEKTRSHFWFWSKTSNVCRSASTDKTAICKQHWQQTSVGDAKSTMKKRGRNRHASPHLTSAAGASLDVVLLSSAKGPGRSERAPACAGKWSFGQYQRQVQAGLLAADCCCCNEHYVGDTDITLVTSTSRWWHRHHADDNGVTLVILVPHWWHCHYVGDTGITLVALTSRWWHWHHVGDIDITLMTMVSRWWYWCHIMLVTLTSRWWHWDQRDGEKISSDKTSVVRHRTPRCGHKIYVYSHRAFAAVSTVWVKTDGDIQRSPKFLRKMPRFYRTVHEITCMCENAEKIRR